MSTEEIAESQELAGLVNVGLVAGSGRWLLVCQLQGGFWLQSAGSLVRPFPYCQSRTLEG